MDIISLQSIITKTLTSRKRVYCAFNHFEECFDKMERNFIFQNRFQENVSSKLLKSTQSMYKSVKATGRSNNEISPFFIPIQELNREIQAPVFFFYFL